MGVNWILQLTWDGGKCLLILLEDASVFGDD